VIIHGVPYVVLVFWTTRVTGEGAGGQLTARTWSAARRWVVLLATIWMLAYVEELVWNHTLVQSRGWLFGNSSGAERQLSGLREVLVPLLAVPQLTHYVLDGFIWKRRSNPSLRLVAQADADRVSDNGGA